MGLSVYVENRIHERKHVRGAGASLERIIDRATEGTIFSAIDQYGDTMFNSIQSAALIRELKLMRHGNADLDADIRAIETLANEVVRTYGYIWVSGD
ncbi:hypothetical protein RND61_08455 [Streptomyces sp. TRM76323]|uniref:Uncharacterized protein n=1 Tax=Streptomyces tamarix TaxID=3078565 RepID=A0ABU3QH66_9ACTN|nr:hypothetical protein [Streptomyces tamarix]MDT9682104.1 hypothetical protein [Streptomyces tamarix]